MAHEKNTQGPPTPELRRSIIPFPKLSTLSPVESISTIQQIAQTSPDHAVNVFVLYNEIRDRIQYLSLQDQNDVTDTLDFALQAHGEQARDSGEPYILHPLWTVNELSRRKVGRKGLSGAALHDVPEDTPYTLEDIASLFGQDVGVIVSGLQKTKTRDRRIRDAETLENVLLGFGQDLNVFLIKFWERFHNFRNIREVKKPESQRSNARETLDIYVPLADEWGLKETDEIAEICLDILNPEFLVKAKGQLEKTSTGKIDKQLKQVEEVLSTIRGTYHHSLPVELTARMPSVYQLYKRTGGNLSAINKALTPEIHAVFPTKQDSLLAATKCIEQAFSLSGPTALNNYVTGASTAIELMHPSWRGATKLIVTSLTEREGEINLLYRACGPVVSKIDEPLIAIKQQSFSTLMGRLREQYSGSVARMEALGTELGRPQIVLFTPDNKPISLPDNARAIDFAYAVSSEVGASADTVIDVNSGAVYQLGDYIPNRSTVRVIKAKSPKPSIDRLDMANTAYAKENIRKGIRSVLRDQNHPDHYSLTKVVIEKGITDIAEDIRNQQESGAIPFVPNERVIVKAIMLEGVNGQRGILEYLEHVALGSIAETLLQAHQNEVSRRIKRILRTCLITVPLVRDDKGIAAGVNQILADDELNIDDLRLAGLESIGNYAYQIVSLGLVERTRDERKVVVAKIQNLLNLQGKIGTVRLGLK